MSVFFVPLELLMQAFNREPSLLDFSHRPNSPSTTTLRRLVAQLISDRAEDQAAGWGLLVGPQVHTSSRSIRLYAAGRTPRPRGITFDGKPPQFIEQPVEKDVALLAAGLR